MFIESRTHSRLVTPEPHSRVVPDAPNRTAAVATNPFPNESKLLTARRANLQVSLKLTADNGVTVLLRSSPFVRFARPCPWI